MVGCLVQMFCVCVHVVSNCVGIHGRQFRVNNIVCVCVNNSVCVCVCVCVRVPLTQSSYLLQLSLLSQLENDLTVELSSTSSLLPTSLPKTNKLQLYLSTCKLLDTAMALPPEFLPHFQL